MYLTGWYKDKYKPIAKSSIVPYKHTGSELIMLIMTKIIIVLINGLTVKAKCGPAPSPDSVPKQQNPEGYHELESRLGNVQHSRL